MPVEVIWDDEAKTIIRQIYSGQVILDDYYLAIDRVATMTGSVDYTVHSIMDRRDILIAKGSYLQALRYGNNKMPDNLGLRVIVNASAITKMMVNVGTRIAPRLINNVHIVETLEQARKVIAKHQADVS